MTTKLKQIIEERGIPQKKIADITGVSCPTVSRYLNGEAEPPFVFVKEVAKYLEISMDELAGNTSAIRNGWESAALEEMKQVYEQRLEDKREHIASLKARIERLEQAHEAEKKDMRQRMDKKNKIIMRLFSVLTVVCLLALYFVVDAYNGDWGLVRYEQRLELQQDVFGSSTHELPSAADDITGLWLQT